VTQPIALQPEEIAAFGGQLLGQVGVVSVAHGCVAGLPDLSGTTPVGPALTDVRQVWSRVLAVLGADVEASARAIGTAAAAWSRQEATVTRAVSGAAHVGA